MDDKQVKDLLHADGFACVPNFFSESELADLDSFTRTLISNWEQGNKTDPDYWSWKIDDRGTEVLTRIHNFQEKTDLAKAILTSNRFQRLVKSIVGLSARATAVALIVKPPLVGLPIPWHRDPIDCPPGTVYNFSIFLDHSSPENGCLEAVAKSHFWPLETDRPTTKPPSATAIPAQKGDIVIHDVRLYHGSGPSTGSSSRRSLITEFTPETVQGRPDLLSNRVTTHTSTYF